MTTTPDSAPRGVGINFTATITLGNALIIVGMLGTGGVGIYQIATRISGLHHAIELESRLRVEHEQDFAKEIATASARGQKDLEGISATLKELRDDYRDLVKASGPAARKR